MIGRNFNLGIGKEVDRGVAVAPSFFVPLTSPAFFYDQREDAVDDAGYGVIAEKTDRVITKKWAEGEMSGNIQDRSIGMFFLAALGQVSSAVKSGETSVTEHTFTLAGSNLHPTFTIVAKNTLQDLSHALCSLKSLKISCEAGKYATFNASMIGKKGAPATTTVIYSDENEFFSKMILLKLADSLAGLSAAEAIKVTSFDISFEKNAELRYALGSEEPFDVCNQQFTVEGNIDAYFTDATLKQLYENGTNKALRIDAVHNKTIGTASNPRIIIDLAKVQFDEFKYAGGINDCVSQTLKFSGFYSLADASIVKIVLTNTQASY